LTGIRARRVAIGIELVPRKSHHMIVRDPT